MKYKFKNNYRLFPLFFALIFICFISVLLLNVKDDEASVATPEFLVSSINDFSSLKKTNEVSYLANSYNYYGNYADVLKVPDGYIFAKNVVDDEFYTTIVKVDFSGTEVWSYKYVSDGEDYRYNIALLNDKVYLASSIYGVLVLNAEDGSVFKHVNTYNYVDVMVYNTNLLFIGPDEVSIVDSELTVLKRFRTSSLSSGEFNVYFDDYYVDSEGIYVLSTKEIIADGSYSPIIYTLDNELSLVSELPVLYDDNQGFLSEKGYYQNFMNFIKDGDNFYQVGFDLHKIDKDGNNSILINYNEINEHKDVATIDILAFNDFYITLDSERTYREDDAYPWEGHIFLNIRDKDFNIVKKYSVNDAFIQYYASAESLNFVDGNIVVKWNDGATYEIYVSEFEFSADSDMCTVVSGTGSDIGDEIKCGEEEFYVLENDGVNVKMMGKYNLLVGSNYEKFILDEEYVISNYNDMELYLLSLQSLREKLEDGYVLMQPLYYYDDDYNYVLTGATISKSLEYKTGTIFCENESGCTEEDLLFLARDKGYFGKHTTYYFYYDSEDSAIALVFNPYPGSESSFSYSYHIFDEPVSNYIEALADSDVRKKLDRYTDFNFITLDDGSIFGIEFNHYPGNEYQYVFLEEPVSTLKEVYNSPEVVEYLNEGYSLSWGVLDDNGYVAAQLSFDNKYRRTVIFENDYSTANEVLRSDELAVYLEEGYLYSSAVSNNGVYFGARLYRYPDATYKTILFDTQTLSNLDLVQRADVKSYLDQGYHIYTTYSDVTTLYCSVNSICGNKIYGIVLEKEVAYDYLTLVLDEAVTSSSLVANNQLVLDKISEGYEFNSTLSYRYYKSVTNSDGTVTTSTPTYYFAAVLRKPTGNSVVVENDYVPYVMEKLQPSIVRQDETAIGAHGDESGAPEPFEVGIVEPMYIWGEPVSYPYSSGYLDYDYYTDSYAYIKYHSYYNTLKSDGFNVLEVDSITVSEINEVVKNVTGEELPLEEWYFTAAEEGYDYVTENGFYILGSIKEKISDEYSWLWGTTYWTRTSDYSSISESNDLDFSGTEAIYVPDDMGTYIYFVDTLGDLCVSFYCQGSIGAGLRPVVTMSLSSIEFNVTTSTDGNGKVVASHDTATSGDTITFNVTPNEGYILGSVTVTDELGNSVVYTDYTFTMPAADVVIDAKFQEKIYFEPVISIEAYPVYNNTLGSEYYFSVKISNPYSYPITDIKVVTNGTDLSSWYDSWTFSDNVATLDYLGAGRSSSFAISFDVTEIGSKVVTAEIVSARAEEPYFFNEDNEYIVTLEAFTTAGLEICNVLDGEGNGSINQYTLYGYEIDGSEEFFTSVTLEDNSCTKIAIPTGYEYELYQIDKMEYELIDVTGHISYNGELFEVEPEKYKITFYNKYNKKGYFHSWDRKENDILVDFWLV